jgi:hypothetical protein
MHEAPLSCLVARGYMVHDYVLHDNQLQLALSRRAAAAPSDPAVPAQ